MTESSGGMEAAEPGRFCRVPFGWRMVIVAFTVVAILFSINQLFNLHLFVGYTLLDNAYLYILIGLLVPQVYLTFPAYKGASPDRVPWYDAVLFFALFGICGYFLLVSRAILAEGWEYAAPPHAVVCSFILWGLVLEAVRRAGGGVPRITVQDLEQLGGTDGIFRRYLNGSVEALPRESHLLARMVLDALITSETTSTRRAATLEDLLRARFYAEKKEVEDVLATHPAVADVAIVAMPSRATGEKGCAFVVLRPGQTIDLAEIRRFLERAGLARQKFPKHLVTVDELPRVPSGKISKDVLRDRAKAIADADAG